MFKINITAPFYKQSDKTINVNNAFSCQQTFDFRCITFDFASNTVLVVDYEQMQQFKKVN